MNQSGQKFLFVLILLLSSIASAQAQFQNPTPKPTFDIFGGYSGYNPGGKNNGVEFGRLPHGWNTGATIKFTPRYALIADFSRYSNSAVGSTRTYLFGPKFTFHRGPFAPFAQLMMGAEQISPKALPSSVAFAEAFGGGLDIVIAHRWSVRIFQADFIYAANHASANGMLNQYYGARVSAGLVLNLGKKRRPTVVAEKSPTTPPAAVIATEPAPAATSEPANPAVAATSPVTDDAKPLDNPVPPTATPERDCKEATQNGSDRNTTAPPTLSTEAAPSKLVNPATPEVKSEERPSGKSAELAKPATPSSSTSTTPATQSVGTLSFSYDQYPTLLSPKDKRNLDAVASRLKLEPTTTAVIDGSGDRYAPKSAAQRAVNAKDYLVRKGIAPERIRVLAKPQPPARRKQPAPKTEIIFVPAGATYSSASSKTVDERLVKPQHLHVAHPEWHEK